VGIVGTNVYAKFHCILLHIKKALGIFRELIPTTTRTTRVAFWDLPSGVQKQIAALTYGYAILKCTEIKLIGIIILNEKWLHGIQPAFHTPTTLLLTRCKRSPIMSSSSFHNLVSSRLSVLQHFDKSMFLIESPTFFVTSNIIDVHIYMQQYSKSKMTSKNWNYKPLPEHNNINNDNNNKDNNVYGAVIVASHFESSSCSYECGTAPSGRRYSAQANRPGLRIRLKTAHRLPVVCQKPHPPWPLLLLSPKTDTHFTIPWRIEDWVNIGTVIRVCSPCPRLYIVVVFTKKPATAHDWSSHTTVRHVTTTPLRTCHQWIKICWQRNKTGQIIQFLNSQLPLLNWTDAKWQIFSAKCNKYTQMFYIYNSYIKNWAYMQDSSPPRPSSTPHPEVHHDRRRKEHCNGCSWF